VLIFFSDGPYSPNELTNREKVPQRIINLNLQRAQNDAANSGYPLSSGDKATPDPNRKSGTYAVLEGRRNWINRPVYKNKPYRPVSKTQRERENKFLNNEAGTSGLAGEQILK